MATQGQMGNSDWDWDFRTNANSLKDHQQVGKQKGNWVFDECYFCDLASTQFPLMMINYSPGCGGQRSCSAATGQLIGAPVAAFGNDNEMNHSENCCGVQG